MKYIVSQRNSEHCPGEVGDRGKRQRKTKASQVGSHVHICLCECVFLCVLVCVCVWCVSILKCTCVFVYVKEDPSVPFCGYRPCVAQKGSERFVRQGTPILLG